MYNVSILKCSKFICLVNNDKSRRLAENGNVPNFTFYGKCPNVKREKKLFVKGRILQYTFTETRGSHINRIDVIVSFSSGSNTQQYQIILDTSTELQKCSPSVNIVQHFTEHYFFVHLSWSRVGSGAGWVNVCYDA